jgi:hypothetical protein
MKLLATLVTLTLFFATANAGGEPYKTPLKITKKTTVNVSLLAAGKVNISWSSLDNETTTTVYEIQKKTGDAGFKTVAILMGENFPVYSFRDKLTAASGTIEYRIVAIDKNETLSVVSQHLVVL